jgi:hypothetical protein
VVVLPKTALVMVMNVPDGTDATDKVRFMLPSLLLTKIYRPQYEELMV